ncbi:MAG TPA: hypothetical protein VES67_18870 [Vicinamibacterales bacterium]|nr:hypothetical protein [Vicinamibacterales bacterium]
MPRATVLGALAEGWRRVIGADAMTASVLAATLLLGQPLAAALQGALDLGVGSGLTSDRGISEDTIDPAARARELGRMIERELLGFFGSPAATSEWLRRDPLNPAIAGPAIAYVALWLFLSGGILDRLARARPIGTAAFFAACGVFFVRFIRLSVFVGSAYYVLFRWVYPWLFVDLYARWTGDLAGERDELWVRGALYLVFAFALMVVGIIADFARVRAVVEDRRGMFGALAASIRFVRRRPLRIAGLYLLNVFALVVILRLWVQASPPPDAPPWVALLIVLVYLLARLWAKLAFFASEVVFFQGELAHANYTAAPLPIWPDSPEAEAMENLKAEGRRP